MDYIVDQIGIVMFYGIDIIIWIRLRIFQTHDIHTVHKPRGRAYITPNNNEAIVIEVLMILEWYPTWVHIVTGIIFTDMG